jgi:XapX domain-containing protein
MRLAVGLIISLVVGIGCRVFDIPVPSPPVLPGALLVVTMTLGYSGADRFLRTTRVATTKHMCGGPTGETPTLIAREGVKR